MALTDTEKQVWWNDSQHKDYTLKFAGLDDIGNSKIDSESMVFEDVLCGDEDIVFGRCCSAKFEIQLADVENNIKGNEFSVSVACDGVISQLGVFVVTDAQKTSNRRFKKVTAYDRMHYLEENVAEWYKYILPDMSTEVTLKTFRDSFFEYMDLPQEEITLINDDLIVRKTVDTNKITGIEIMQAICEMNGVFGHFDKNGTFCYVSISDEIELLPNYISSSYQDYETQGINRLQIHQENGDIGYATDIIDGVVENDYIITGNFLTYGMSPEELKLYGDRLLIKIQGISYKPAETNFIGLPYLELGKRYTIESKYDNFNSVIMSHILSGGQSLKSVISATGNQYRNEAIDGLSYQFEQLRGRTNVLVRNVNETLSKLTDLEKNTESQFKQTAEQINSKVSKGSVSSEISQEADQITIKGDRLVIEATNFKLRADGVVEVNDGYIGGIKIGAEGLSSEDYETLKILKDGTGKFTNLTGEGQGHIDLTTHHATDEEKDEECFFRTEDGFHADYDTKNNVSAGMYVNSEGNATFSRVSGKQESRESTGEVNLVIEEDSAKLIDNEGNLLPFSASNIPKAGFSQIKFVNSTFESGSTSDSFFNTYVRDINHPYEFWDSIQAHSTSNGFPYIIMSYETEDAIHFIASAGTIPCIQILDGSPVQFSYAQLWTYGGNVRQPFLDITYNLDTEYITSVSVTKVWIDSTNGEYYSLDDACKNISIYFPLGISSYWIQLCATKSDYNEYFYRQSENLLRKGTYDGEIIAEITPGKIEENAISAVTTEDDFTIKAGNNIDIVATPATKEITVSAKIPEATESVAGLLTSAEKVKLKNIEQGAEVNVQADWNVTDKESDAYIHNKPVALSAFNNDKNFIDNTVSNLVNYYTKSNTYSKDEVNTLIGNIVTFDILVVSELPTENISTHIIYFVPKATAEEQNVYDEYVNVDGTADGWEHLGDTKVDLSNYYTIQQVDALLANKLGINDNAVSATTLKLRGTINSTTDWDTLECGIYNVNAANGFSSDKHAPVVNGESAYGWGVAVIEGADNPKHQTYYSHTGHIYTRIKYGSFRSWTRVYNSAYHPKADMATTATKLGTARTIQTNLASTSATEFDGSANVTPGVTGTLQIANGGTGATNAKAAEYNLLKSVEEKTGEITDSQLIAFLFTNPDDNIGVLYKKKVSLLWNYIKSKADIVYATKTALDKLSIGGRNLLIGTANFTGDVKDYWYGENVGTETVDIYSGILARTTNKAWNGINIRLGDACKRAGVKIGDTVTLSIMVKASEAISVPITLFRFRADGSNWHNFGEVNLTSDTWVKLSHTFVVNDYTLTTTTARFECETDTTALIYWAAPKFEKGNKPTDWTPAPEDYTAEMEEKLADYLPVKGGAVTNGDESVKILPSGITGDTNSVLEGFDTVKATTGEFGSVAIKEVSDFKSSDIEYSQYVYQSAMPALYNNSTPNEYITTETVFDGLITIETESTDTVIVEKTLSSNLINYAGAEIVYKYESAYASSIYNTHKLYFTSETFADASEKWTFIPVGDGTHLALIFKKVDDTTVKISARSVNAGLAKITFFKTSKDSHIL